MIIKRRKIWYIISTILVVTSLFGIFVIGLPLGLDFTGGNIAEVEVSENLNASEIAQRLEDNNITSSVQSTELNNYIIKFNSNSGQENGGIPSQKELSSIFDDQIIINKFDSIGPTVSHDLQQKAAEAMLIAMVGIILYIAWAFKNSSKTTSAWSLGVIAVIALIHDSVIVTGVFCLLSQSSTRLVIDTYFITAILTIIGYSVNDTIVIFDRLREIIRKNPTLSLLEATERGVQSTMARSLNTSFTVLIVIASMLLLGGSSLFSFLLALLLGVIVGTYSSIFIAAPLFVSWNNFLEHRRR